MKWMSAVLVLSLSALNASGAESGAYDPMKVSAGEIVSKTLEVAREGRSLPVRAYLPESTKPAPVILFSHGLGGSRDNNPYLGNHWAKRGYVVIFIQHPGSDEQVWKNTPRERRMLEMRRAASGQNLILRAKDIPAVIDALAKWNTEKEHPLMGRLDLEHIGMAGHSFGAVTTQAVAGQGMAGGNISFREPRIDAAVMMSPSKPAAGDPVRAFESVKIPCLLMTGTLDTSPIANTSVEDRLQVYPNLKNAPAWQVVFDKAKHMSFGDRDLRGNPEAANRYHKSILALTTAFWDAELCGNKEARSYLNGEGARSVMEKEDRWEMNARARPATEKK